MNETYSGYRVFMPYCIKSLGEGRFIVLNRDYKPLGIPSSVDVDLKTHESARPMNITSALAREMSVDHGSDTDCIYLHKGNGPPEGAEFQAYVMRLAVLMRVEVTAKRPYRIPPESVPRQPDRRPEESHRPD